MKQLWISAIIISALSSSALAYPDIPPSAINDIHGIQGINKHDMQLMLQQKFRQEEFDETKDIQEQKNKKNKELENAEIYSDDPAIKKFLNKKKNKNVNFVQKDGQIKIEETDNSNNKPQDN